MTFQVPAALSLLATALLVALLTLLRARQRRREVATFFVWRELHDSVSSRAQRLRSLLDPLFLLQLAALVATVLAVAQPLWVSHRSGLGNLALLVDASASMSTQVEPGRTRYEVAVARASEILESGRPSSVSVVLVSRNPRVLAVDETRRSVAAKALVGSSPTWEGGAGTAALVRAVEAIGGASLYERIVYLTDHSPDAAPFPFDVELVEGGAGIGITAFSVRETPNAMGVSAFVKLQNQTDEASALRIEITDDSSATGLDTFLGPREEAAFVIPFPTSRGSRFTASIGTPDPSPYDNVRYASLLRSPGLRVRWIGSANRYLDAALAAAAPIVRVDAPPADLTIVVGAELDLLPEGNVLLVHSSVRDAVQLGPVTASGTVEALADDPLLSGVRAADIYVERMPSVDVLLPARVLLAVRKAPFLLRILDATRLVVALPSDLSATNLPITVDFPLLIRNLVELVSPPQPAAFSDWNLVGTATRLARHTSFAEVLDPKGRPLDLMPDQQAFFPSQPGHFAVRSAEGDYVLSANVDPEETRTPGVAARGAPAGGAAAGPVPGESRPRSTALWPIVAGVAAILLLAEAHLYERRLRQARQTR